MKTKHPLLINFVHKHNPSKDISFFALDKGLSGLMILLLSPVMIVNILLSVVCNRSTLNPIHKIDALGHSVVLHVFSCGIFRKSALLIDIFKGSLSFCGVPLTHSLTPRVQIEINEQYSCNPGIFSLFNLHKRTGLVVNDAESLLLKQFNLTAYQNVCLVVKSVVCACLYGSSHKNLKETNTFTIFGLTLNNSTMQQAVNWATTKTEDRHYSPFTENFLSHPYIKDDNTKKSPTNIGFFINVNSINISLSTPGFQNTLQQADMLLADGSGMRLAAKSAGFLLKDNTNGTDMLPHLCKRCVEQSKSVYFLGSKPGVAEKAASNLTKLFPGLKISGTQHGYINPDQYQDQIQKVNDSGADILLVAMGSPFQEEWLLQHRDQLTCNTALAVGGLFDFYSGDIARAPLFIRELGLEWIWRLSQEPINKFSRYIIGNPLFLFRIYVLGLANKGVK
jgi:N-acetylglucosaminyldiphosphoundecaprenol N-acetyl-beta-D-mannosaminyltransferase